MRGETTDGNRYIEQAVARGAVAVVTDSACAYDATANGPLDVALVEVPHGRRALARLPRCLCIRSRRYGSAASLAPTENDNGVSAGAVCCAPPAAPRRSSERSNIRIAGEVRPAPHTTPESRDLLALLAEVWRAA